MAESTIRAFRTNRAFLVRRARQSQVPAAAIAMLVVGVGFTSDGLRRMLLPGGVSK